MVTASLAPDAEAAFAVFGDLATRPVWLAWRYSGKNRKKVPIDPKSGKPAKVSDPATWGTLAEARAVSKAEGVGIMLRDGLVGIDLDGCRDPDTGQLADWARERIDLLGSYTEVSPSGTGVKVFAMADGDLGGSISASVPDAPSDFHGGKAPKVELFDGTRARYFAVTGQHLDGTPLELGRVGREVWDRLPPTAAAGSVPSATKPISEIDRVRDALRYVPADDDDIWLRVTAALRLAASDGELSEDEARAAWTAWSMTAPDHFDERGNEGRWNSFRSGGDDGRPVATLGTLFHIAKANGWPGYVVSAGLPEPLGYTEDGGFALLDRRRGIIRVMNSGQLMAWNCLVEFAPISAWGAQFPPPENAKLGFNAVAAGTAVIEACKRTGPFDPTKVRGRGVWLDRNNIVVNLGQPLAFEPDQLEYTYTCFKRVDLPEVGTFETRRLLDMLEIFHWHDPKSAMLFLGWLSYAAICGVLEWRPHIFVTGEKGSGKSALFRIADDLLRPLRVDRDGGSSEAGIRQTLGPNSAPVLIDDLDTDKRGDEMRRILLLMRSAASSNTTIARGTTEGKAMQFSPTATFFAGGVNSPPMAPPDQDRIVVLRLDKHRDDREEGRRLKAEIAHFRDAGTRWCGFCVTMAGLLRPSIDVFDAELGESNQRTRLTFATMLAAAFVALNGRVPSETEAREWAAEYLPTVSHHAAERADRDNPTEALDHLMAHIPHGERHNLGAFIRWSMTGTSDYWRTEAQRVTRNHGIETQKTDDGWEVLIVNRAPQIEALFDRTPWKSGAWMSAIRRVDGVEGTTNALWVAAVGKTSRCTVVPGYLIPEVPEPEAEPLQGFPGGEY